MKNEFELIKPILTETHMSRQRMAELIGWQYTRLNTEAAHKFSTGDNIGIAILDTGYTQHEDLKIPNASYDMTGGTTGDVAGHGSHVFGICAATFGNAAGIAGIAPDANTYTYKVLSDNGGGSYAWAARALRDAADHPFIHIANMSFGSNSDNDEMAAAIEYAKSKGLIMVAAAGNNGDRETAMFPARHPDVIGIMSHGEDNDISGFSASGIGCDFVAPGEAILSTVPVNKYATYSGTSMAAPAVAAVIALGLAMTNREASKDEIFNRLVETAQKSNEFGHYPDAAAFVTSFIDTGTDEPTEDEPTEDEEPDTGGNWFVRCWRKIKSWFRKIRF